MLLIFVLLLRPRFHILIGLLWFLAGYSSCPAQQGWTVRYHAFGDNEEREARFTSKPEAVIHIRQQYSTLLSDGYLDARIDTIVRDSTITAAVLTGPLYNLRRVSVVSDSSLFFRPDLRMDDRTPLDTRWLNGHAEEIITEYENRGYPFASIELQTFELDPERSADVVFRLEPGPRIVLDSLIIRSSGKIPMRYVRSYLGLHKGEFYSEEKIQGVQGKLRELVFLQSTKPAEVRFTEGRYDLYIFLEKKKANYFNGILGLRPNEATGKITITGDAEIKLLNALNTGEEFYLNWRKLQPQTQDLTVRASLPYMFATPLGLDGELKIYRRDSTFSSVKTAAGIVFNFGGNDKLKLFAEKNTTNQLATFQTAETLGNVNMTLYGLSIQKEKLDYRLNPRRGYSMRMELATGMRTVNPSNDEEVPAVTLTRRNVHRADASLELFAPTFKLQCLRFGMMGSLIEAESIYDNEMFRIGGLRTIRGINEESIYATTWAVASVEYRLLFEENSALYVFADQGWYEKKGIGDRFNDTPLGFGAGVNFETAAGIFTFNYALGSQFDNPILVRNAKISFGFRNVF